MTEPQRRPASVIERGERLGELHRAGCFVLPCAWDAGSAIRMELAGFAAIGTTSGGVNWAAGRRDYVHAVDRDEMLAVYGAIAAAVDVPVSADLEHGYGDTPAEVADTIRAAIELGLVGGSVEDQAPGDAPGLVPIGEAAAKIAAARAAADATGVPFTLTARAESYFGGLPTGVDPFDDAVARCRAYVEAGADCVFAPGLADLDDIASFVEAVGAPVSVGIGSGGTSLSVEVLASVGVRRISTGGVVPRALDAALGSMLTELADGSFAFTADATIDTEMDARADRR